MQIDRLLRHGRRLRAAARACFARRLLATVVVPLATACEYNETPEQAQISYAKNVESCLCRTMNFESDFPSGLRYSQMVARCNETVHGANPARYDASLHSEPETASLRCPEDVEPWLEVAGERAFE